MAKKIIATCTVKFPRAETIVVDIDVSEAFVPGVKPSADELNQTAFRLVCDKLKVKVANGRDVAKALGNRTV